MERKYIFNPKNKRRKNPNGKEKTKIVLEEKSYE